MQNHTKASANKKLPSKRPRLLPPPPPPPHRLPLAHKVIHRRTSTKTNNNKILNREVTLKLNRKTSGIIIQQPRAIKYACKSAKSSWKQRNDEIRGKIHTKIGRDAELWAERNTVREQCFSLCSLCMVFYLLLFCFVLRLNLAAWRSG